MMLFLNESLYCRKARTKRFGFSNENWLWYTSMLNIVIINVYTLSWEQPGQKASFARVGLTLHDMVGGLD